MTTEARRALAAIRECISDERYALAVHFMQRMEQRGLFWTDVQAVIDNPDGVRSGGVDRYHRPKWLIQGDAVVGGAIEIVCVLEVDDSQTEFITLYWED